MFLPRLRPKTSESDEGLFLIWKCPSCDDMRNFNLIVSKANFSLAGFTFSEPVTMLDLRCTKCRYELKVAASERALLTQAREATNLLQTGELSAEAYWTVIKKLPARFVADLKALTQTWKCVNCEEANPVTFDSCWNCRSKKTPDRLT
jgi:hypothetical protein